MSRICESEECGRPYFGRGYCSMHYYRNVRKARKEQRMATCAWCKDRKPLSAMRPRGATRGKTPSTCLDCRESNPTLSWCDFHEEPHPRADFQEKPERPIGINNECRQAAVIKASRRRDHDRITCASCDKTKESWSFRGGGNKCVVCRDCESLNPGTHWCRDCSDWRNEDLFCATGRGGKSITARCQPCRTANSHGVTVAYILAQQGVSKPECAACGSIDFLKVDHDHNCCPTASGCEQCVRGYLCHGCNSSEGLLQTPERARLLMEYMIRVSQR